MDNLFFVKVTDYFGRKKVSYLVNCNQIKYAGVLVHDGKIIYHVELISETHNSMCLHHIRKSDYERLKRL